MQFCRPSMSLFRRLSNRKAEQLAATSQLGVPHCSCVTFKRPWCDLEVSSCVTFKTPDRRYIGVSSGDSGLWSGDLGL